MRSLFALLFLFQVLLPLSLPADPTAVDAELSRIQSILDKGQAKRARGLFKAYLALHPESLPAREGYEAAGGDLSTLGLGAEPAVAKSAEKAPLAGTSPASQPKATGEAGVSAEEVVRATLEAKAAAPVVDGPTWRQRMQRKLASVGRASLLVVALLGALVFIVGLGWAFVQGARWHQARHHRALLASAQQRLEDGSWPTDLYVELRFWSPYWGFGANSERITNAAIRDLNAAGWACAKILRQNRLLPSVPSTKLVLIWMISAFSLGFLNYYSGPVLWLRRREPDATAA